MRPLYFFNGESGKLSEQALTWWLAAMAYLNYIVVFEFLGNSSNNSRKQIFRDILANFSYFIMKMCVVCTH